MTTTSSAPNSNPDRRIPRPHLGLVVLAGVLAVVALTTTGCSASSQTPASSSSTQPAASQTTAPSDTSGAASSSAAPAATELKITDKVVGTGATAKAGDTVTVDYTGWLMDGTKFDSSIDRKQPFTFPLGGGQVIPGWDQGVAGMKVGGTRVLIIPPSLGYGSQGAGGVIPPNATLKFEVKLLKVEPAAK